MATEPQDGESPSSVGESPFVVVPAADWTSLHHGKANVRIRDRAVYFAEGADASDGDASDDGMIMLVGFQINVFTCPSPESPFAWCRGRNPCLALDWSISWLADLRGQIIDHVFERRTDMDDLADFLVLSVGLFAYDYVRRFESSAAVAGYDGALRRCLIDFDVMIDLDETDVSQLRRVAYEGVGEGSAAPAAVSEKACPICLQDFVMGEEVDVTQCGHPFHPQCILRWLVKDDACPLCRSELGYK